MSEQQVTVAPPRDCVCEALRVLFPTAGVHVQLTSSDHDREGARDHDQYHDHDPYRDHDRDHAAVRYHDHDYDRVHVRNYNHDRDRTRDHAHARIHDRDRSSVVDLGGAHVR